MKVLSSKDEQALTQLLLEELPVQVLDYVSSRSGQPAVQVVEAVLRGMPSAADVPEVRQHVSDVVNWFVQRGDICYSLRRKLFAIPPHGSFISGSEGLVLALFGDSAIETQLREALKGLGGRLDRMRVYESEGGAPLGLERRVVFSEALRERVESGLQSVGVVVIDPESVRRSLPHTGQLVDPAPGEYDAPPPALVNGSEEYQPHLGAGQWNRWRPAPQWRGASRLLRSLPSQPAYFWERRYFLHNGTGGAVEIPRDEALIWMFSLDRKANAPIPTFYEASNGELNVEGSLPPQFLLWFRLLTGSPSRLIFGRQILRADADLIARIAHELDDCLGVRVERVTST